MMQAVAHRVPTWHADTRRWRLRVGYYFGKKGKRVERPFWWPGQRGDGNAPPAIIAAAVARQDEWDKIELDWPKISVKLKAVQPEGDGDEQIHLAACELARMVGVDLEG